MSLPDLLSEREQEAAEYLLLGKTNKQIALEMGVSTRTVEYHISHIYEKLGVASRAEAIVWLTEARMRESANGPVRETATDLRESTVAITGDPVENGSKFAVLFRRITMNKVLLVIIGLAALACLGIVVVAVFLFAPMQYRTYSGITQEAAITIPEITATPWLTATPFTAADPAPTAAAIWPNGERYSFEGVEFTLAPALASGARGQVVLENPGSADGPYWQVYPRYVDVTLSGYRLPDTANTPSIAVYPAEDYRRLSSQAHQALADLQRLLDQRPADLTPLPFLPLTNSGQVFHSNVAYLNFQNGSGVRYLTQYAQGISRVNNHELFYTFQGLSADGSQFVSVTLPVSHSILPASADALSEGEYTASVQNSNYYTETAAALSAQPDSSFAPDLAMLDTLVESLVIGSDH